MPGLTLVVSEDGGTSEFSSTRLRTLLSKLEFTLEISPSLLQSVVEKIQQSLPATISSDELLSHVSETLAQFVATEPCCADLAGRVQAYRLRKIYKQTFSESFQLLRDHVDAKSKNPLPLVSKAANDFVQKHSSRLDQMVVSSRDYDFSYFGMRTLVNSYLLRRQGLVAETPQYLFMRVAVGIHGVEPEEDAIERVAETYSLMSQKYFIHSSPTLYNAATENGYLSLCFLLAMEDDSIDGIFKTLHKVAMVLKGAGGIGIHVNNIRAAGSPIKSSNGTSSGLVPMLRVFNNAARYVDQGGNKRPGAIAVYLEPWHADIEQVLDLRKNHGSEELRARDLFYALWIPDLFMEKVKSDAEWSLFSPSDAPGLDDVYGQEFQQLYEKYETQGLAARTVKARKLWMKILSTQIETGMPYMLYKDACNAKLNQKNLGTIKSSNLCCEIVEYSSRDETAVCNLALIALPKFVKRSHSQALFDFQKFHDIAKCVTRNLDRVIDVTRYPIENSKVSNIKNRPVAVGVQGIADLFMELRIAFDSPEAQLLNEQIFETLYHGAVEASCEMSEKKGPYSTFAGSPASEGSLQFDLWAKKALFFNDWDQLKQRVKRSGLRNSLLVAPMPTASTSQILGFNECFEPITSNIYYRRVLSGEFQVVNKYLVDDLKELGLWNSKTKEMIISENGLIQHINNIPASLKPLYKTVWEISQRTILKMAADRGAFIDQLQSMNIHLQSPSYNALTSCHFYAWELGLKTGMYYLRTQAAARPIQFTVDSENLVNNGELPEQAVIVASNRSYHAATTFHGLIGKKRRNSEGRVCHKTRRINTIESNPASREASTPDSSGSDTSATEISTLFDDSTRKSVEPPHEIFDTQVLACKIPETRGCDACSG